MELNCIMLNTKLSGQRLHAVIKEQGYSVKELQQILGLSCPNPIYKWLSGKTLPSVDNLYRLSILLKIHMEDLLVENEYGK